MEIELLYSEGCHTWKKTLVLLKEIVILKEKEDVKVKLVKINTQEEAEKYHYFGSPQINIDGKDIDPMAEKITNFSAAGCRLYVYEGKTYELPPEGMIKEALNRGGQ